MTTTQSAKKAQRQSDGALIHGRPQVFVGGGGSGSGRMLEKQILKLNAHAIEFIKSSNKDTAR